MTIITADVANATAFSFLLKPPPIASKRQMDLQDSAITVRSLVIGCFLAAAIAVGIPYGSMVIQGTRLGLSSSTPAAFFLLFIILLTANLLLGLLSPRRALQRGELIVIFIMMMVATAIPTRGVIGMLLPMITGTHYYATYENNWAGLVHPFLTDWMVVDNPRAIKNFYEGVSGPPSIPWDVWTAPLLHWLIFYLGFYLCITSAIVILRKQWVEHERLIYPLAQVPLAMVQDGDRPQLIKPFFKNPIMWCGFLLPFFINSINALHNYYPFISPIVPQATAQLFRGTVSLNFRINFLMFGFAYFISSNISFSLWFFYLVHLIQEGLFSVLGIFSPEELGPWTGSGPIGAIMGHQMMGALTVLVCYGLWTARDHLKNVFRKALNRSAPVDDSGEILSYRAAVLGFFGGAFIMAFWLWRSGIPAWITPFFIFSALVIFIGLARVIAEAGLPTVTPEMVPAGFVVSGVGVPALGAKGMVATGYSLVWAGDLLVFMTVPLANSLRLSGETSGPQRRLFVGIAAAMLISLVCSVWFMLYLAYRDGALNLHPQYFTGFAAYPSSFAAQKLASPTGPSLAGWLWTAAGGLLMGALMLARHQFVWWPFHPLGFAVSTGWVMNSIWFSIFLAWMIKGIALKYGGPVFYQKSRPFFIGVVLGQFVVGGTWLLIDACTGMVGNRIPVY